MNNPTFFRRHRIKLGLLIVITLLFVLCLGTYSLSALGSPGYSGVAPYCASCGSIYQGDGTYPSYGGTDPVNGEPYADVFFKDFGVNPFIDTEDDPLSTFALDVDTGSYVIARRFLADGYLPPSESVRVEEFVNYFDYGYSAPKQEALAIHLEGGPTPFVLNDRYQVIRIGIQGKEVRHEDRKDATLIFVIDTSGSMDMENRLGAVKHALAQLVETLRPTDRVGIVAFGDQAQLILPVTATSERAAILDAIESLQPSGSTNAASGLILGYEMASRAYRPGEVNRVILCSDGVANTGQTAAEQILEKIRGYTEEGIELTTVGFGMGNYNDVLMERLADEGDGFYAYVDTPREAEKLFVEELSMLETIARDAKVQVSFNPETVTRYRLLGFENRALDDEDFRDDTVDAGEVGAGHDVTALYEVKLVDGASGELAEVALRWEDPDTREVRELTRAIAVDDLAPSFESTSDAFKLAVLVAEFAEILRESYWADGQTIADLTPWLAAVEDLAIESEEVQEFISLVRKASKLAGEA